MIIVKLWFGRVKDFKKFNDFYSFFGCRKGSYIYFGEGFCCWVNKYEVKF